MFMLFRHLVTGEQVDDISILVSDLFNHQSRYSDQIRPVQDQSKPAKVSPSPMFVLLCHLVTGEQFDDINILVSDLFNHQSRYSDQIRPVQEQSKPTKVSPSPMFVLLCHLVTGEQFDDINILVSDPFNQFRDNDQIRPVQDQVNSQK